ncbi:MAG: hypothetical protein M1504_01610 [Candidatus Marsarchaeota archaeon]|nr:hypothetical protein [Candidatus Marsarchaeota archaeon]
MSYDILNRAYGTIRSVYKPKYILLNIALIAAYWIVYSFIIEAQTIGGLIFTFVPQYLIYALVFTSSILTTISVYAISNTRKNSASVSGNSVSVATILFGGLVGGCGCQTPLLLSFAAIIGTANAFSLNNFFHDYQVPTTVALLVINLLVIGYYLNKLSTPSCKIRKK